MNLRIQLSDFEGSDFDVENGDFGQLEIRKIQNGSGFHYFYDTVSHRLIKNFRLDNRPRVATLCEVALIRKGELLTPRVRFWKRNKSATALKKATASEVVVTDASWTVKSSVDTSDCHIAFWTLLSFLQSCAEIDFPASDFRISPRDEAELARSLDRFDRQAVLSAVQTYLGGPLSTADVNLLLGRRGQLEYFERLLKEGDFFRGEVARLGVHGSEGVWQRFFEENSWIFVYGLTLLACEAVVQGRLEQITVGASLFSGAGKRSDAVLHLDREMSPNTMWSTPRQAEGPASLSPRAASLYKKYCGTDRKVYGTSSPLHESVVFWSIGSVPLRSVQWRYERALRADRKHLRINAPPRPTVVLRSAKVGGALPKWRVVGEANKPFGGRYMCYWASFASGGARVSRAGVWPKPGPKGSS